MKEVDGSGLEHTSCRCQYHVVFAPKYRRMEIYGKIKENVGIILRKLCQQVGYGRTQQESDQGVHRTSWRRTKYPTKLA